MVKQPIILIAQLNRAVEGKMDKRPSMADIRESGSIEEVADVIIFPHREAYFDKKQRKYTRRNSSSPKPKWSGRNVEVELCEADE